MASLNATERNKVSERKQCSKKKNSIKERCRIVGGDGGECEAGGPLRRSTLAAPSENSPLSSRLLGDSPAVSRTGHWLWIRLCFFRGTYPNASRDPESVGAAERRRGEGRLVVAPEEVEGAKHELE